MTPLILDGAFGTMAQTYHVDVPVFDVLCLTRPDIVADIHRQYLEAGADIITTNSFNANAISLAEHGLQDQAYHIARRAAEIARSQADKYSNPQRRRWVAGSIGPTNRTLSMGPVVDDPGYREVSFDQMRQAFSSQVQGLLDGGADIILIETVFDSLNAKAAIKAVRDISPDCPIMVSGTISDASGRLLSGQTIEAFCASVAHAKPYSIGLNCGKGARHLLPYLRRLREVCPTRVSVHPNAGMPNIDGGYDQTPEMFAADMQQYIDQGLADIVGGCCGTTPAHIRALAALIDTAAPRPTLDTTAEPQTTPTQTTPTQATEPQLTLAGLEPLTVGSSFISVGERTNVAGSAKFARLIREGNYAEALQIARAQVEAGANIIDVCMDAPLIDGPAAMRQFLNLIAAEPEIARVPVMIDSSDWDTLVAGMQCTQGKSIVNSISLKEGEDKFIERAREIMSYGAAAVVMLFDENGQADTYQRKIAVAQRAYDLLKGIGFAPEDIIIDPNILAVATGIAEHDRYARDFIDATRWIKANLPGAKVSGGVSNLSFAFRGNNEVRKAMHAVFMYHAIQAGMDMAIVNPQMVQLYADIDPELLRAVEDVVLYSDPQAADRLLAVASKIADGATKGSDAHTVAPDSTKPTQTLQSALLRGDTANLTQLTAEALAETGDPFAVINHTLMPAMERVGAMFGEGKMFLPQVVKSARVMKQAVDLLLKDQKQALAAPDAKRVVLATVKGDVHDIGKNIVSVVLQCNGVEVHDLGVMVEAERIIDEAMRIDADAIGLSGLITPSLTEMRHVAQEAHRRGVTTPIIIGGATTTQEHTALKIAPVTDGPVIHANDAADTARIVTSLPKRENRRQEDRPQEDRPREDRPQEGATASHPDGCPCCQGKKTATPAPASQSQAMSIAELEPYINWAYFFSAWGIPGRYPELLSHPTRGQEARRLYDDAQAMLKHLSDNNLLEIRSAIATFPARRDGDDIIITLPSGQERALQFLRNDQGECVSDFVDDTVTLFAISAGFGVAQLAQKYRDQGDDYSAFMVKLLADRLTEAYAEATLHGGCRIAFGYPTAPDHTLKRDVFEMLDAERLTGMRLTDNCMIMPGESICGIYLPRGHYFSVTRPNDDVLAAYAQRRRRPLDEIRKQFK